MIRATPTITHAELVDRTAAWAASEFGLYPVLTEPMTRGGGESPDVLGWLNPSLTMVFECKVSASDGRADHDKPHRQRADLGAGNHRYVVVPQGVTFQQPDGWGWVEVDEHGAFEVKEAPATLTANRLREFFVWRQAFHNLEHGGSVKRSRRPGGARVCDGVSDDALVTYVCEFAPIRAALVRSGLDLQVSNLKVAERLDRLVRAGKLSFEPMSRTYGKPQE